MLGRQPSNSTVWSTPGRRLEIARRQPAVVVGRTHGHPRVFSSYGVLVVQICGNTRKNCPHHTRQCQPCRKPIRPCGLLVRSTARRALASGPLRSSVWRTAPKLVWHPVDFACSQGPGSFSLATRRVAVGRSSRWRTRASQRFARHRRRTCRRSILVRRVVCLDIERQFFATSRHNLQR